MILERATVPAFTPTRFPHVPYDAAVQVMAGNTEETRCKSVMQTDEPEMLQHIVLLESILESTDASECSLYVSFLLLEASSAT